MFVCGVQVTSVELQCHVTETNLCAGSGLGASQVCHQPSIWSGKRLTSQAPQVPPGFQARGTLRSWLCTDAQRVSSLRMVVIVAGHRAPRYVLVALRHGANFRGEARLAVFLLPRCGFPVVCYSQRVSNMFKSSVTAQEELVRTRKGYPSRRYVPTRFTASRSHLCPVRVRPAPGAACTAHATVDMRGKSSNAV